MESPLCPDAAAKGAAAAGPAFRLIETFGYQPGQGIARADLHLARLSASAAHFGIAFDAAEARRQMAAVSGSSPLRCRMTLAPDGQVETAAAPMPPAAGIWHFAIASARLASGDPWLRHKTTRRALYDDARAHLPAGADELVFLNERGEICEGTITNIMLKMPDGRWLTPPLQSGCLPGVFRQSLLNAGQVQEAVLALSDLHAAKAIRLTNALRGSIEARWAPECAEFARFA